MRILSIILLFNFNCHLAFAAPHSLQSILDEIQALESKSDPKCYATASRLEDFMFGTPLTDEARFSKNILQKQMAKFIWAKGSELSVDTEYVAFSKVDEVVSAIMVTSTTPEGHIKVELPDGNEIIIHETDLRQYSSIAYSLRALLTVQQEQMLSSTFLKPLTQASIEKIAAYINIYTLAVLKVVDNEARINNLYEVEKEPLTKVWFGLAPAMLQKIEVSPDTNTNAIYTNTNSGFSLLKKIIKQKVSSYEKYNDVNNQLFVRNLQVYFARVSWPQSEDDGRELKSLFTDVLISFSQDLYRYSEKIALNNKRRFISEADVQEATQLFIPHTINEYEDAVFFPRLEKAEQIVIEAYDMDAFRDSGLHWTYLQYAIEDNAFTSKMEPTPFAAELLAENIAQFGVLILRAGGQTAIETGKDRFNAGFLTAGLKRIQAKIEKNGDSSLTVKEEKNKVLRSATKDTKDLQGDYFTNVTENSEIKFEHRTSSWLNRLLRSYLPKDGNVGVITIPPAFGGAGVAAGDVNNDDLPDILLLSGSGNKLYINLGDGTFKDITQSSGLDVWRRGDDKLAGEPRQPLIADIDNDGLQDIVITYVNDKHRVYKNIGGSVFKDMTDVSALGGEELVGGPATIFDFDNDGLLDIYITYFGDYLNGVLPTLNRRNTNGLPNKLFKNLGGFKFKDVSNNSGIQNTGWGQAVTHTDFNRDGKQDLIVGNDFGVNSYYLNQGQGVFIDVASELATDKPSYTMNISLTDLNDDNIPDVYISNIVTMNKDQKYVLPNENTRMEFNPEKLANMRVVEANDLFLSNDKEQKLPEYQLSKAIGRGYSSTGWAWGADFFDFDNDTDDDLYVVNGMNEFNVYSSNNPYYTDPISNESSNVVIPVSFKEKNVFFVNEDGKLKNVSKNSGLDVLSNSRSIVYIDYDQDGDLDIVLNNYHEPAVVFRNNSEALKRNWLKVKLLGSPEHQVNRDGIGATISLKTKSGERIWRQVTGSIGYMSVQPKVQHFGLGSANKVDLLVTWPNGKTQTLIEVDANSTIVIQYEPN